MYQDPSMIFYLFYLTPKILKNKNKFLYKINLIGIFALILAGLILVSFIIF